MAEKILLALIAALIGSLSTILIQWWTKKQKRKKTKEAIRAYLSGTILPLCEKLKIEIRLITTEIQKYGGEAVTLGTHPTCNSEILRSYKLDELHPIYKDGIVDLVGVMGTLDYLNQNIPNNTFPAFVNRIESHIDEHLGDLKVVFEQRAIHYNECPTLEYERHQMEDNLNHAKDSIESLEKTVQKLLQL